MVTILVVFTIYVLKLRPKKSDINFVNNNNIFDKNKITSTNLFSRNENAIKQQTNEVPVEASKKATNTSLEFSNNETDVWNKNDHLKKIII
jgi:hypothetical protein